MSHLHRAEKALIKAMGAKPSRLSLGSVEVIGSNVKWEEVCRSSSKRGGGKCLHARYSSATPEVLDAFFEALRGEA